MPPTLFIRTKSTDLHKFGGGEFFGEMKMNQITRVNGTLTEGRMSTCLAPF